LDPVSPTPTSPKGSPENLDLAAFLEGLPAIVYVAEPGPEGAWLYVSPQIENVLGFTPAEWYAHPAPFTTLVHPDDFAAVVALEDRLVGVGDTRAFTIEFRMQRRDGTLIWIHERGNLVLHPDGRLLMQGLFFDVSDRHVVEEQLRQANRAWHTLFDANPAAVMTWNREGRILTWNASAERMFGWTADEVIGQYLPQVPEEARAEMQRFIERGFEGRGWDEIELVRRRKDGTDIDVSISGAPLRNDEGEIVAMMSILSDITGRKAAEERLREQERELRQREQLDAIGKLAGGIAHDFNNLLTVIQGQAALALDDAHAGLDVSGHLGPIIEAAERAGSLTRQLLAFGRRQVLQPRILDVNEVVRGIAPLLRRLVGEAVELSFRLGDAPRVEADPTQLDQVLINLVSNARDAMPRGGSIVVETSTARRDDMSGTPGEWLVLTVTDTGVGMDENVLARAFEPFFTTKPVGAGTGLGLSTVYGIVAQSGGEVSIDSRPGEGSTVTLRLPVAVRPAPELTSSPAPQTAASGGQATVVLVEDDPLVRGLVTRLLTLEGYSVIVAPDAIEALAEVERNGVAIDLLVTDVVMPSMSGPELAERLRERQPELAVLFISGYNETAVAGYGVLRDEVDLLRKPFSPDDLTGRVRAALDRR
jgi:PAS domain S-box-containing protein